MSNFAASSPIFESFILAKSTVIAVALLGVADAAPDAVLVVAGMPLDVALRRQQVLAALLDLEVDVRRAAGVRHRLDGAEVVFAGASR